MNRNRKILVYDFLQRFAKIGTRIQNSISRSFIFEFRIRDCFFGIMGDLNSQWIIKIRKRLQYLSVLLFFFFFFLNRKIRMQKKHSKLFGFGTFCDNQKNYHIELSYIFYKVSSIFSLSYHLYLVYFAFSQSKMRIQNF